MGSFRPAAHLGYRGPAPGRWTPHARRDNRGVLRVGRLVVAVIGALEGGYFGFVSVLLLFYAVGGLPGSVLTSLAFAALAAGALGGAAGTLGNRRWGGTLVALTSGLALAFWIVVGYPDPRWLAPWGLATMVAIGVRGRVAASATFPGVGRSQSRSG